MDKIIINYARHGDLSFKKIDVLPKNLKEVKEDESRGGFILAEGEHTGHYHCLVADKKETLIKTYIDDEGKIYMVINNGNASLKHQEHKTITFSPGIYIKEQEQEYDYYSQTIMSVKD